MKGRGTDRELETVPTFLMMGNNTELPRLPYTNYRESRFDFDAKVCQCHTHTSAIPDLINRWTNLGCRSVSTVRCLSTRTTARVCRVLLVLTHFRTLSMVSKNLPLSTQPPGNLSSRQERRVSLQYIARVTLFFTSHSFILGLIAISHHVPTLQSFIIIIERAEPGIKHRHGAQIN